jgi:SAM-dependent methyltransferase
LTDRNALSAHPGRMTGSGTSEPSPAWHLLALADGYLTSQLLYVAAQLRLADVLAAGPRSAAEVAAEVGADPGILARVLRGLCLDGVFTEHPDGRFSVGPLGEFLREDVPDSQRGPILVRGGLYYPAVQGLLDMATDGDRTPAFERHYGQPFFAHLDQTPDHAALFQTSMAGRAAHEAAAIVKHYDLTGLRHLVDVGAGPGVLAQAALQATDGLTVTLLDQPPMIERARRTMTAAGLTERCTFVEEDFFIRVPAGGDAYVLSRVLHDWNDEQSLRILRNCHAAMPPAARLLIVDAVLPVRAGDAPPAIRMDLLMLLLFNTRERTEAEFRHLLSRAGFDVQRIVATGSPTGVAVIEARPT